jgi:signal transduction histidine kinase
MHKFWRSAAMCLFGGIGLASVTLVCFRLQLNLATAALLYLMVVVLLSLKGSFVSSVVVSVIAVWCLAFFFAPPILSFRVDDPLNVVAIMAFLTVSLVITRLVSRVHKLAEKALSSVSHRVIDAEEQERQRIAKDLHEDIGQRLALLAIEIEQLKTDSPNQSLEVRNRMDAVWMQTLVLLTDVKTSAHELHSPRLEYLGLAEVMRSFCSEFGERKRVEIDFSSHGLPGLVPPDISLCLFRVLQEALHNAVKHSGIRRFDVELQGTSGEIHLTVSEEGAGFNLEAARKGSGLGLNRMQERLKLVKGILFIDSQPKRGTTIRARVPSVPEVLPCVKPSKSTENSVADYNVRSAINSLSWSGVQIAVHRKLYCPDSFLGGHSATFDHGHFILVGYRPRFLGANAEASPNAKRA